MLRNLEEVVNTIDVNDEEGVGIEEMEYSVTSFTEMAKRMRMQYDKYCGTHEKMNPLVYIAPIFDPRYKLVGPEVSLCDLFGEIQDSAIILEVKEKLEALFDEYWQFYKPLIPQSGQSSGHNLRLKRVRHLVERPLTHKNLERS